MYRFKYIIVFLIAFLIVGCGANVDYDFNVDTSKESISMEISMEVKDTDYKYIQGGKEALVNIINTNLPNELEYKIDEVNDNKFIFTLNAETYDEYKSKYKKITNVDSTSVFKDEDSSSKSPFKEFKNIEINDDLTLIMNWLKDSLKNSGMISEENKSKIISAENCTYQFNNESTYDSEENHFYEETSISIENVKTNILLKEGDKMDLGMSFLIESNKEKKFTKKLENFIQSKKTDVKIKHKEKKYKQTDYEEYTLEFTDLNLNKKDSLKQMNSIFGENFIQYTYANKKDDGLIKVTNNQSINMSLNFNNLFELEKEISAIVEVDLKGIKVDSEGTSKMEFPYKTKELSYGNFHLDLKTYSEHYQLLFIGIMLLMISIVIFLIIKFKPYKSFNAKKLETNKIYNNIEYLIKKIYFNNQLEIKEGIIESEQFIVKIDNIVKIDYANKMRKDSVKTCFICWGTGAIFIQYISLGIGLTLLLLAVCLSLLNYMIYKIKSINVELSSGMSYHFTCDGNEKTYEMYIILMQRIKEGRERKQSNKELLSLIDEGEGNTYE